MTNGETRIFIVDDHAILREGLRAILETEHDFHVVGEADTGAAAIEMHRTLKPDVTLMDLQMPGLNGIEAISAIRREAPQARVVVLTTYSGDIQAIRAIRAGAAAYLLKTSVRTELVQAIRAVRAGHSFVTPAVAEEIDRHALFGTLTEREIDILRRVAAGRANNAIAADLGLSIETIKGYLKSIFAKLDVADRTEAVAVAVRRGGLIL